MAALVGGHIVGAAVISLAKLSIRRPAMALAAWLVVAAALSAIGFGIPKAVSPSVTVVPGTQSARAEIPFADTDLINVRQFGLEMAVAILLDVLLVRPVLLPAAETPVGRFGWWPTRGPGTGTAAPTASRRHMRLPLPHQRPRSATSVHAQPIE